MNPNDLYQLAKLLKLHGETVRLFSDTQEGGDGEVSRITEIAMHIEAFAVELARLAKDLGATEP